MPCEGGVDPFTPAQVTEYLAVVPGWHADQAHKKITKKYSFKNFKTALEFVDSIGALAESEGHHPDIGLGWGYVTLELSTHAISGLSENDFILAYKIDALPAKVSSKNQAL